MRRHVAQPAAAVDQRGHRRLLQDRRPRIHFCPPVAAQPVIARDHRHAVAVHAVQVGPGQNVGGGLRVVLRHAPAQQDGFELRAMCCVRCRHGVPLVVRASLARGSSGKGDLAGGAARVPSRGRAKEWCRVARTRHQGTASGHALLQARLRHRSAGHRGARRRSRRLLDRRVTRRYRDETSPIPCWTRCLAAAQSAPTKSDLQQYSVVVMRDRARIKQIADWIGTMDWIATAPVFLVWCGDMRRGQRLCDLHGMPHANNNLDTFLNTAVDCTLAMGQFIAAADAAGLGTCPISYVRSHIERVTPLLGLPPGVYPVAGLTVGWPVFRRPIAMRLPPSVVVHRERYDDTRAGNPHPRLRRTPPRARTHRRRQPEEQRCLSAARRRRLERERRAPALGAGTFRLRRLPEDTRVRPCLTPRPPAIWPTRPPRRNRPRPPRRQPGGAAPQRQRRARTADGHARRETPLHAEPPGVSRRRSRSRRPDRAGRHAAVAAHRARCCGRKPTQPGAWAGHRRGARTGRRDRADARRPAGAGRAGLSVPRRDPAARAGPLQRPLPGGGCRARLRHPGGIRASWRTCASSISRWRWRSISRRRRALLSNGCGSGWR